MTIVACPHCKEGFINTEERQHCLLCGRELNMTDIVISEDYYITEEDENAPYMKKLSWCWVFFDCGPTKMRCRRPKGHKGKHDEHEDSFYDRCYAVRDRWHKYKNGDEQPEVRSNNPCWKGDLSNFINWVKEHGGSEDEIYPIEEEDE